MSPMQVFGHHTTLRSQINRWRKADQSIAFVPTMGNLHQGHLSLVKTASEQAKRVVVSIFVNPLQFGPAEDFQNYPRTLDNDLAVLKSAGVDAVYTPEVAEIYPRELNEMTYIEVPGLSDMLCGKFRPGHFRGVATIVNKLFNLVQPDVAVFGEKDFQQVLVIRRMVDDLSLPVNIVTAPTLREESGLAMSSRNSYLSVDERRSATAMYATLCQVRDRIVAGRRDFVELEREGGSALENFGFRPDYFSIRRRVDLGVPTLDDRALVVLCAAYLGATRLIDNVSVEISE